MREIPDRAEGVEAPSLKSLLQFREEFFNSSIETSIDAVLVINKDGSILFAGGAVEKDFGYRPDGLIGLPAADFIHRDDRVSQTKITRRAFSELGRVMRSEPRIRHRDGRWIACEVMSRVVISPKGERVLLTKMRDITERLETQRRMAEYAETLHRIIDACPDIIAINRLSDGCYVDISPSFAKAGFSRESLIGKSNAEIGVWADAERHLEFRRRLIEQRVVRDMEAEFRNVDGRIVPCLISATITEISGEPCAVAFVRDISELKRTEARLRTARADALAASRAKSEFISSTSHEIRAPMNAILGMAELMRAGNLGPEQSRYLDLIVTNGNSMLNLVNSILDLSKIEAGRLTLESVEFGLCELVESVTDNFALRADQKGLELATRFDPGLPEAFIGDPLRLRQILINLIGNAVKFTSHGEVAVNVKLNPARMGTGGLLFAVSDTGIGIPAENLEAIFAPFEQSNSATTRLYGGSGLGLSIVAQLAGLMGGKAWAESKVGSGSTFYFTVELEPAAQTYGVSPPTPEPGLHGIRALVVDDSPISRLIVREMLAARGALVSEASSAFEGMRLLEESEKSGNRIKLLMLDGEMPAMGGLEMIRRMSGKWPLNSVVMMLGVGALATGSSEMRELGLHYYVAKPIKRHHLFDAVSRALAGGGAGPSLFSWPHVVSEEQAVPSSAPVHTLQPSSYVSAIDRPLKILLADDSSDSRLLIGEYLRTTPYILDRVDNGREAIERFKSGKFDLILMDMRMPDLDGYETVRMIRQWEFGTGSRPTPIVALTAAAMEDDVRRASEAGCNLHLSKPIRKATLLQAIAKCVEPH
ncbi:MAG TPA: response regulator [Candidatus Binataceae bacterium]|nr:response regulator [Candidatus Binataceae bacterium]